MKKSSKSNMQHNLLVRVREDSACDRESAAKRNESTASFLNRASALELAGSVAAVAQRVTSCAHTMLPWERGSGRKTARGGEANAARWLAAPPPAPQCPSRPVSPLVPHPAGYRIDSYIYCFHTASISLAFCWSQRWRVTQRPICVASSMVWCPWSIP